MHIEIMAKGPAHRVEGGETSTDRYNQRDQINLEASYYINRTLTEPNPDIAYYFHTHAKQVAEDIKKDSIDGSDWDIKNADPDGWEVLIYAGPEDLRECAEVAETEQDKPAEEILLEWAEYERAPTEECREAFEQITGHKAPGVAA